MSNLDMAAAGKANEVTGKHTGHRYFIRLNIAERVQHMILVVCFIVLAITGFMINIPEEIMQRFGTVSAIVFKYRGLLHRIAGTTMILVSVFHIFYLLFTSAGRRWLVDMLPRPKDLMEMINNMLYYVGFKKEPPEFDRFCYKHKLEYFALFAGIIIVSVTGLLLWTEHRWDKFILDIATLVHSMEAVLASLAIMIWHLYEVHLRPHKFPIDNMWITGVIDEEEMKEEYALHYKKIMNDPGLRKIYMRGGDQEPTATRRVSITDLPRIN